MTETNLAAEPRAEDSGFAGGGLAALDTEPSSVWRWLARAAVLLPIVVAVVRALVHGWFPIGDAALLAIRAYDVGTSHNPLLGSWTSASFALGIDVNNPGPLYPDLLAPFMWTFGRAFGIGTATAIGVGTINGAAALGTALVGARVGGWRTERWMLLLVAALTWSMGSELLIDIWQPHALLLPFCALVALTIAVACGDVIMLPVWAGVASLIVQTHVAYIYAVGVLVVVVTVALVLQVRAGRGDDRWVSVARRVLRAKAFLWTLVVLALAWIQPLWEQLFGKGEGNLQRLATHAGEGNLTVGAGTAVKIVSAVVALPPWWTRGGFEDSIRNTPLTDTANGPRLFVPDLPSGAVAVLGLVVVIGLLIVLIASLRHTDQRPARMACVVSLAMLVVAVAGLSVQAVTRTGLGSHQVRWLFGLSVIVHVSILWGAVEWAARRWSATNVFGRRLDIGLGVVLAALTLANIPFYAHNLGPTAVPRRAGDAGAHVRRHRPLRSGRPGRLRHRQSHTVRAVQHGGDDATARTRHRVQVQRRVDAASDGGAAQGRRIRSRPPATVPARRGAARQRRRVHRVAAVRGVAGRRGGGRRADRSRCRRPGVGRCDG